MSWNLSATGAKAAVAKRIAEQSVNGQAMGEAAKVFIAAVLEDVPSNGVVVKAWGHHDAGTANVTVQVESVNLALDEPESESTA